MRKLLTLAAVALLLSTTAFAQSVGEKTGVNSALGISPTTADFVKEVAMSDMTEIAAAKIGQERGMVPADAKAAIPAALDSSSQSKIDKLKNAKPDDFSS